MDCSDSCEASSPVNYYKHLFKVTSMIPMSHYLVAFACVSLAFWYNFLEFHFLEDLFTGGSPVTLTYNPASELYHGVVSKCSLLHHRYHATPWLASPHLQTTLLEFVGKPQNLSYTRQLFYASDGGTFALDWLLGSDVSGNSEKKNNIISKKDTTPIVIVVPGLTGDSTANYVKHLVYNTAKRGWNVVVCNHRGMGGIPLTSDCFYNAGWTTDLRDVVNYLHDKYPEAPLFAIGTSIGANILVKFLGEYGENIPLAGAAAICNPWDLLIGSRYIARRLVQNCYGRILTMGLQAYAQSNQAHFTRLADWDGIIKARHMPEFDKAATCAIEKFETADEYYRWCSSASYTIKVRVPLLCISALDDPVCTPEAIPWHECRTNKNVILATTKHGGHLGFFEEMTASGLWWVRATNEFLGALHSSPHMHKQNKGSYLNVTNGMGSDTGKLQCPSNVKPDCASDVVDISKEVK